MNKESLNDFERGLERYFSKQELHILRETVVAIGGAGGLGSNCAVLLARCGIRQFIIDDYDIVDESNLNRQHYFLNHIGMHKVDALTDVLHTINPAIVVNGSHEKLTAQSMVDRFQSAHILVEAFDQAEAKEMFYNAFIDDERFKVVVSGIAGIGNSDSIITKKLGTACAVIGDGISGNDRSAPYAPRVMIGAAKEADAIVDYLLRQKSDVSEKSAQHNGINLDDSKISESEGRKQRFQNSFYPIPLYGITAEKDSKGRSVVEVVKEMLDAGYKVIQYREKEKSAADRYNDCFALRELTRTYDALFIIDDFVDLAIAVDADGVHIGQEDLPPQVVRQLIGPHKIIGLSTHSPAQLEAANELKDIIDYIGIGPVYATNTKPTALSVGLEYVEYGALHSELPFVTIGGIKTHNVEEVRCHGAHIVCVVSEVAGADNIKDVVKKLCRQ